MRGSRRAWRGCRAGLLLAMIVSGLSTGCRSPSPKPPPADRFTKEQRAQAMLSVHAWARWPAGNFDGAPFVPLADAINVLRNDDAPGAGSRRRRAVAKLAGYGFDGTRFSMAFQEAIQALGVDSVKLREAIREKIGDAIVSANDLEVMVINLPLVLALTPDCKSQVPTPAKGGVHNPPPVAWSFDLLVPRPVNEIARALDPQSWHQCSTFFYDSYLATTTGACCPGSLVPTCATTMGTNGRPLPAPAVPVGKPYGPAPVYERFCISDDCSHCPGPTKCNVSFENLLCATTSYDIATPIVCFAALADRYDVHYNLGHWMSGELLGTEGYSILYDFGTLSARRPTATDPAPPSPGTWSVVHVDKTLDLNSSGGSAAMGKYLQGIEDELIGQIIDQACCDVPKEVWIF